MARDTRSPEEIERDLSQTRHHLEGTLDALQARMSPGSLFEDALDYARRDGGAFGRNLIETVRDNPVPATLLTIGLGWMMMSGRTGAQPRPRPEYGPLVPAGERQDRPREPLAAGDSARERLRGMGESVRAGQDATVHGTAHAAHAVGDRTRRGWDSTRTTVGGAVTGLGDGMRGLGERSRAAGRSLGGFFEESPLAAGALAVAAGAALAAFLPRTRMEDEALGPLRQRAVDQGRAQAGDVVGEAARRTRVAAHVAGHPEAGTGTGTETEAETETAERTTGREAAGHAPPAPPSAMGASGHTPPPRT